MTAPTPAPEPMPLAPIAADEPDDFVVIAKSPVEMAKSHASLVAWATGKVEECRDDFADLKANLETARTNGWRTDHLTRSVGRAEKRLGYYEKVEAALRAGYYIVPNFPIDIFAVRTVRRKPLRNEHTAKGWVRLAPLQTESPPIGKGIYVGPEPRTDESHRAVPDASPGYGGQRVEVTKWAVGYEDVDFPFALAKPEIMTATAHAMSLKLFDEMGVLVDQGQPRRKTTGDPMVIGRITLRGPASERSLSFVVSWFLDTRTL